MLRIRAATRSDAPALSAIAVEAKRYWNYTPEQLESWRDALCISELQAVSRPTYVAELNGAIAGFYSLLPASETWELKHLWVLPQFMRRGVGRFLVAHAIATARHGGAVTISIDAEPNAEQFYVACGAAPVGCVPAPLDGNIDRVRPQLVINVAA